MKVTFDPKQISYGRILQIYFSVAHNPTELNYQGPDHGPQYRSEIFPQSEEQAKIAKAYIAQLDAAHVFKRPDRDQDRHHDAGVLSGGRLSPGLRRRCIRTQPYIVFNDAPKVANLKTMYPALWRDKPVLVAEAAKGE